MLEAAVVGIPEWRFWKMTLRQVHTAIEAHSRRIKDQRRLLAEHAAVLLRPHQDKNKPPITADDLLPKPLPPAFATEEDFDAHMSAERERLDIEAAERELKELGYGD